MASIADLDYGTSDAMAASKKPLLTDLRAVFDAFETYVNNSLKDNIVQTTNDCFGTGYALDSDGSKNFTGDLYNKQSAVTSYSGGDITISTTGSWVDIDASNVKVTFTPDYLAGDFKVTCTFSVENLTSNATNEIDVRFRLTDGSTNSDPHKHHIVSGVSGSRNTHIITIAHEFASLAASSQTVKAQYFIQTTTANTVKILANSNAVVWVYAEKV